MELQWTQTALTDLERLHEFLDQVNPGAAARVAQALVAAPRRLLKHPRMGERLEGFGERQLRRIPAGRYEIRYEVLASKIFVLRIWHSREDR